MVRDWEAGGARRRAGIAWCGRAGVVLTARGGALAKIHPYAWARAPNGQRPPVDELGLAHKDVDCCTWRSWTTG